MKTFQAIADGHVLSTHNSLADAVQAIWKWRETHDCFNARVDFFLDGTLYNYERVSVG